MITLQFGNLYYLVMELVGGGDLCSFIKAQRNGKLDERCTRVYARQLVSAISHMHNVGIVHRYVCMYIYIGIHIPADRAAIYIYLL